LTEKEGGGYDNIFTDTIFTNTLEAEVKIENLTDDAQHNIFNNSNVDVSGSKLDFDETDYGYLEFNQSIRAYVADTLGNPLETASILFNNSSAETQTSVSTGVDGYTDYQTLFAFSYNSDGLLDTANPYTVTATYDEEVQSTRSYTKCSKSISRI